VVTFRTFGYLDRHFALVLVWEMYGGKYFEPAGIAFRMSQFVVLKGKKS
jgi:hypothetical protein